MNYYMFRECFVLTVHSILGILEILDWGFPQLTDPDALKLYITQAGYISEKVRRRKIST